MPWRVWKPEFSPDKTLTEVLSTMPRDEPEKVPWQIKLLENPKSPLRLPGAISLFRHDCLHAMLCTSFYSECEAWTLGYTMGAAKNVSRFHVWLFKRWSAFYPGQYALTDKDLEHFDRGFEKGRESPIRDVHLIPFERPEYQEMTMGDLRKRFNLHWIDEDHEYQQWAADRWGDKPLMEETEPAETS